MFNVMKPISNLCAAEARRISVCQITALNSKIIPSQFITFSLFLLQYNIYHASWLAHDILHTGFEIINFGLWNLYVWYCPRIFNLYSWSPFVSTTCISRKIWCIMIFWRRYESQEIHSTSNEIRTTIKMIMTMATDAWTALTSNEFEWLLTPIFKSWCKLIWNLISILKQKMIYNLNL